MPRLMFSHPAALLCNAGAKRGGRERGEGYGRIVAAHPLLSASRSRGSLLSSLVPPCQPPFLPPVLYTIASCDNEQYELRCILFCGSLRSALRARSSAERYYSASRGRQLPARNNSDKFRGTS